jgi:hypothetical protein
MSSPKTDVFVLFIAAASDKGQARRGGQHDQINFFRGTKGSEFRGMSWVSCGLASWQMKMTLLLLLIRR